MAVFWSYFRDFIGTQKIEDLTKSKNVSAEVFQITSRFVVAEKKVGVRCTESFLIFCNVATQFSNVRQQLKLNKLLPTIWTTLF